MTAKAVISERDLEVVFGNMEDLQQHSNALLEELRQPVRVDTVQRRDRRESANKENQMRQSETPVAELPQPAREDELLRMCRWCSTACLY